MKAVPAVLVLLLAGCAYYNGVYNARIAEKRADRLVMRGDDSTARERYADAAREAEAVLTHHPRSRWAREARLVAGRAWALAERCDRGLPHLERWLSDAAPDDVHLERASLAYGRCLVVERRLVEGRDVLHPLSSSANEAVGEAASLWAARAALGLRDFDLARSYLLRTGESHAEWELALAYVDHDRFAEAEPLLLSRALDGDVREEMFSILPRLWRAGHRLGVQRIVQVCDRTEPAGTRARLHLLLGELMLAGGEDGWARVHLTEARQLSRDGDVAAIAAARLTRLSLRDLPTLLDVVNTVGHSLPPSGGSGEHRRLWSSALLASMLARHVDHSGAALFLAGEVARDSLRAFAVARSLFLQVADRYPRSPIAPKALLATAVMSPDVPWYRARLLAEHPQSAFSAIIRGEEPADRHELAVADSLLVSSWIIVLRAHADSVNRVGVADLATELRGRAGWQP